MLGTSIYNWLHLTWMLTVSVNRSVDTMCVILCNASIYKYVDSTWLFKYPIRQNVDVKYFNLSVSTEVHW